MRECLQRCIDTHATWPDLNIDMALIILRGGVSGIVKNWLMEPEKYNLYSQAPALVDNLLKVLSPVSIAPDRRNLPVGED